MVNVLCDAIDEREKPRFYKAYFLIDFADRTSAPAGRLSKGLTKSSLAFITKTENTEQRTNDQCVKSAPIARPSREGVIMAHSTAARNSL